jgi:hypothetical protein
MDAERGFRIDVRRNRLSSGLGATLAPSWPHAAIAVNATVDTDDGFADAVPM